MDGLLAKVIPLAFGAAISPMVLTVSVFILAGRAKPIARAWVFAAGCAATLVAYSVLGSTLLKATADPDKHSLSTAIVRFTAAALLLLLAIRAARATTSSATKLMARLDNAQTWTFFLVGAATMVTNFSTLVLFLPALHEITKAAISAVDKGLAYALLLLITLIPALVPVLLATLLGSRADGALAQLNTFVTAHAKQINVGICLLFALLLTYGGIQAL